MMTDTVLDFDDVSGLQEKKMSNFEDLENTQEVDSKDGEDLNIGTHERDIDEAIDDELDLDCTLPQNKKKLNINELKPGIPIEYDGDDEEEEMDTQFGLQEKRKRKGAFTSEDLENTQEVDPKDGGDLNIDTGEKDIDESIDDELDLDFTLSQKKRKKLNINELKPEIPIRYDSDDDDEEEEEDDTKYRSVFISKSMRSVREPFRKFRATFSLKFLKEDHPKPITDISTYLKNKLIDCLEKLKTFDCAGITKAGETNEMAQRVLHLIYHTGINEIVFSSEEEKNLGSLLSSAIRPMQRNIIRTAFISRTRLENSVLMKRSAIQFLIDVFAQFPVDDLTLGVKLEEADIRESVDILDEIIDGYCDLSDSDEGFSDRDIVGGNKVPPSHEWWLKGMHYTYE